MIAHVKAHFRSETENEKVKGRGEKWEVRNKKGKRKGKE